MMHFNYLIFQHRCHAIGGGRGVVARVAACTSRICVSVSIVVGGRRMLLVRIDLREVGVVVALQSLPLFLSVLPAESEPGLLGWCVLVSESD